MVASKAVNEVINVMMLSVDCNSIFSIMSFSFSRSMLSEVPGGRDHCSKNMSNIC